MICICSSPVIGVMSAIRAQYERPATADSGRQLPREGFVPRAASGSAPRRRAAREGVSPARADESVHASRCARRASLVGREHVHLAGEVLAEAEDVVTEAARRAGGDLQLL